MTTVIIDNYDSFSYNLYQLVGSLDRDVRVVRNDGMSPSEILAMEPDRAIISPGPEKPADAGICEDFVRQARGKVPILGVCLGHQAICEAYGATVTYAKRLMHGKTSEISMSAECPLFKGLGRTAVVGRYHSLAADPSTIPESLQVVAASTDGEVMAVQDSTASVFGVQFHPESILTPEGPKMLANFMEAKI